MFHRPACGCALLVSFLALGCSAQAPPAKDAAVPVAMKFQAPAAGEAVKAEARPAAAMPDAAAERKIVFNGTLDVEVKDFGAAHAELGGLMRKHKAFFVKTEIRGDSGQKRHGTFTIKVPVESFHPMVEALAALGNPLKNTTDSQDVTEEFVDVEARVKNLKAEEEVLNKLLKEAGTRLEDLFKIREHVRTNREQIERAEARLQVLNTLTSLSTITLTLRDKEEYVAPTAAKVTEPASFGERATGTFASSVGVLRAVGEAVAMFAIAVAPWLPLLGLMVAGGWVVRKRLRVAAA